MASPPGADHGNDQDMLTIQEIASSFGPSQDCGDLQEITSSFGASAGRPQSCRERKIVAH
jgi:hypothetical protein